MWGKRFLLLSLAAIFFFFLWISFSRVPPLPSTGEALLISNSCRQDLTLALCSAIRRAEHHIDLAIFSLNERRIVHELRKAARRGVEVHILYDRAHSPRPQIDPPLDSWKPMRSHIKGLMHLKILIIDEQELWLGSANYTDGSLRLDSNLLLGVKSPSLCLPLVQQIRSSFRRGQLGISAQCGPQFVRIWQLPAEKGALPALIEKIDSAQSTLRVALYTWTEPQLTAAVIRAHQRGVGVETILDRSSSRGASKKVVAALREAGVPIRISEGEGILHHKFAWIDGETLMMGSANWTRSAFQRNRDTLLLLSPLTEGQREQLQRLWRILCLESVPLCLQESDR